MYMEEEKNLGYHKGVAGEEGHEGDRERRITQTYFQSVIMVSNT